MVVNNDSAPPADHLAALLHNATRRARAEAEAAAPAYVEAPLRASESRLLDLLPPDGGRVSELAAQLGVSKQALGQLALRLADLGYASMEPDPIDRRAKLVRRTATGDRYRDDARELLARVEAGWRAEVGARRYEVFRAVLREIAYGAGQDGR